MSRLIKIGLGAKNYGALIKIGLGAKNYDPRGVVGGGNENHGALLILALGGAILILAFLSLWQRNQMIYIGYEIEQLKEEREALLRAQKELLVEAESLSAVERIERIAVEQLAMKPSLSQQRIYINAQDLLPSSEGGQGMIKNIGGRRSGSLPAERVSTGKDVLNGGSPAANLKK